MIQERIAALTEYGLATGLIAKADERYTINRLLDLFCLREPDEEFWEAGGMRRPMTEESAENALERILADMLDYAVTEGLVAENTTTHRDLFDTRIMSTLVPRPSEVIARFYEQKNQNGAKAATDYFYKLSCDSDYIRRYRIKRDLKWVVETEFGSLDLTINLSKPEKDPKEIAA
ncbi:MAG: galactose-1-phosphate uridylyltransferase, partial [Clostridiales bacterium]|nr:galactose-1-phosphate uridylyltransferase [Clostridiales bacterium]